MENADSDQFIEKNFCFVKIKLYDSHPRHSTTEHTTKNRTLRRTMWCKKQRDNRSIQYYEINAVKVLPRALGGHQDETERVHVPFKVSQT